MKDLKIDGNVYVISDTHFGHVKCYESFEPIRQKIARSFNEFENEMVNRWNAKIGKDDVVIHLGDFCINKMNEKKTIENIR